MTVVANGGVVLSVREKILQNLATRFTNVQEGDTVIAPDGTQWQHSITWNKIIRHIPSQAMIKVGKTVALIAGKETTQRLIGFEEKHLYIVVEFYDNALIGDDVSTQQSALLLEIQTTLFTDKTCGGFAYDIVEVKNECSIEGPDEKVMAGMLEIYIAYRHRAGNPRLQK